jgi:hypothetical protein
MGRLLPLALAGAGTVGQRRTLGCDPSEIAVQDGQVAGVEVIELQAQLGRGGAPSVDQLAERGLVDLQLESEILPLTVALDLGQRRRRGGSPGDLRRLRFDGTPPSGGPSSVPGKMTLHQVTSRHLESAHNPGNGRMT